MADVLERTAEAEWRGDLRSGNGQVSTQSGAVREAAYSFSTRFENQPGSNPEELLAAAEAACYSMALANELAKLGHIPDFVRTRATCILTPQPKGGFKITGMNLDVRAAVSGINEPDFQKVAKETSSSCPVSVLLEPGLEMLHVDAALTQTV